MHARAAHALAQVWRWAQQYRTQLLGAPMPEMVSLIAWLQSHIPAEDADPTVTRISHGDFRCAAVSQHHLTCDQRVRITDLLVCCPGRKAPG